MERTACIQDPSASQSLQNAQQAAQDAAAAKAEADHIRAEREAAARPTAGERTTG
ncbi:hypothetical protein [Streptomyces sp. NPDC053560]|uniref:hypothetical protein n=1 Tax=Streptomyces sp. NPDC053560 TaxID=3365711 RepID=UPI0037D76FBA